MDDYDSDEHLPIDALQRVVEAAMRHQALAGDAINAIAEAADSLKKAAQATPARVAEKVDARLAGAALRAVQEVVGHTEQLRQAFENARHASAKAQAAAERAQASYEHAGQMAFSKALLGVFMAGLLVIGILAGLVAYLTPGLDEVQARRAEVARLEEIASKIEPQHGKDAQILRCTERKSGRERLCVRVDDGTRNGALHPLKGH